MTEKLTLETIVDQCLGNKEMVAEFDRLSGTNLSRRGNPLELMIDEATDRNEVELHMFAEFVMDVVIMRLDAREKE